MRLKDDLSGPEWQRTRNAQVFGAEEEPPVVEPLSDNMRMDAWQLARNRQVGLGVLAELGAAGGRAAAKPDVDWKFIRDREDSRLKVYVPVDEHGRVLDKSGPTIGAGFDLGQRNLRDLKDYKFSSDIEGALTPYLGKKGQAADDFVRANPRALSEAQVREINEVVQGRELDEISRKFDAASQVGPFHKLPRDTQTAIASLYFQYGSGDPATSTPNYWRQITTGDWSAAHRNLRAFGDKYRTRRGLEADLLQRDIVAGKLPKKP